MYFLTEYTSPYNESVAGRNFGGATAVAEFCTVDSSGGCHVRRGLHCAAYIYTEQANWCLVTIIATACDFVTSPFI